MHRVTPRHRRCQRFANGGSRSSVGIPCLVTGIPTHSPALGAPGTYERGPMAWPAHATAESYQALASRTVVQTTRTDVHRHASAAPRVPLSRSLQYRAFPTGCCGGSQAAWAVCPRITRSPPLPARREDASPDARTARRHSPGTPSRAAARLRPPPQPMRGNGAPATARSRGDRQRPQRPRRQEQRPGARPHLVRPDAVLRRGTSTGLCPRRLRRAVGSSRSVCAWQL